MKRITRTDFLYENRWFTINTRDGKVVYRLSQNKLKIRHVDSELSDAIIMCDLLWLSGHSYLRIINSTLFDHTIDVLEDVCVDIIKNKAADGMIFAADKVWFDKAPGIHILEDFKIYAPRVEKLDRRKYRAITAKIRRLSVDSRRTKSSGLSVDARRSVGGGKIRIDIISPWRNKDRNKDVALYVRGHKIPLARFKMAGTYAVIDEKIYAVIEHIDDNIADILGDTFNLLVKSAIGNIANQHMKLKVDGFIYHFRNASYRKGIHSWKLSTIRQLRIQKRQNNEEYSQWRLRFRKMQTSKGIEYTLNKYILKIDTDA